LSYLRRAVPLNNTKSVSSQIKGRARLCETAVPVLRSSNFPGHCEELGKPTFLLKENKNLFNIVGPHLPRGKRIGS